MLISHADRLEDVLLYRALRQVKLGFYIDVGANSPLQNSLTQGFYELGWTGINIDPVRQWYEELVQHRPNDVNLCLAAGAGAGTVLIHELVNTGLSTAVEEYADRHEKNGFTRRSFTAPTRALADICAEHVAGEIHFMKIDVEGSERAVLEGCDLERFRPWVVVVEATAPLTDIPTHELWEPILTGARYDFVHSNGLNRFYLAQEHADLRAQFVHPPDIYMRCEARNAIERFEKVLNSRSGRLLPWLHRLARPVIALEQLLASFIKPKERKPTRKRSGGPS
jgi:FkbM family methyltransferase